MAATWMDPASNPQREQERQLTRRLRALLWEAGSSDVMSEAQRAELLSITRKLELIWDKYDTCADAAEAVVYSSKPGDWSPSLCARNNVRTVEVEGWSSEIPYYGGCPICGKTDGYLNVGAYHWFICDAHCTRWYIATNLFSSWEDETETQWRENHAKLKGYANVKPARKPDQVGTVGSPTEDRLDVLAESFHRIVTGEPPRGDKTPTPPGSRWQSR